MSDFISVTGIRGFGHHGVLAHESELGQEFSVDVTLGTDVGPAARSDDLADTVNYGEVAATVHALITSERYALIETLADRIAATLVEFAGVRDVTVAVHKPHAPMPVGVGDVVVQRFRRAPARVVLGLGANLGDRAQALQGAVNALGAHNAIDVAAVSPIFATAPVGGPEQPDYLNAVAIVRTTLSPHEMLRECHQIEAAAGRERVIRWGPRTLDLDLLEFDGRRMDDPELTLPHPRAAQRAFVLAPWAAVAPDDHPGGGPLSVAELLAVLGTCDDVRELPQPTLSLPPRTQI